MIILDTNVLSELMRSEGDPAVARWLDVQAREFVWTTAITIMEGRFGIERLAVGRRREQLELAFSTTIQHLLGGRVLSFDQPAAEKAAIITAERERMGRPIDVRDIQIAGIAAARKATLVTRNTRHFDGSGIALVNPWAE